METLIVLLLLDKALVAVLVVLIPLVMSDSIHTFHLLLPDRWKYFWLIWLFVALEMYTITKAVTINMFTFLLGYAYIKTTKFWLRQIW